VNAVVKEDILWLMVNRSHRMRAQIAVRDGISSIAGRAKPGLRVTRPSGSGVNAVVKEDILWVMVNRCRSA
jgi:hypothetical protein